MVEHATIVERLGELFSETFKMDTPDPEIDLLESGLLDSFQFVELLMKLEQDFDFQVDIQKVDLDDLRSLERIAQLVDKNTAIAVNGRLRPEPSGGAAS